jgi:hypothetical protein
LTKKKVTIPELTKYFDTLVDGQLWEEGKTKTGKWKGYDLFKNNWEHNVIIVVDAAEKTIQEWLAEGDSEVVDEIFKIYKLKIDDDDLDDFTAALQAGIENKKVGVKIRENSVRCIP